VSPNGKFVYTFNEVTTGIGTGLTTTLEPVEGFSLNNSTGALTPVNGSPFANLLADQGKFDQSGQFIIAIQPGTNTQQGGTFAYAADPTTGALSSTLPHTGVAGSYAVTDEP
jgi:hypothetical protein